MNKRMTFLFFGFLLPMSSSAFIYRVQVLKHPQENKYVIGLSDYHDKTHVITNSQRMQLERLLARCNPKNSHIIVEDLSSKNNTGRQICGNFRVDSRGGILGDLTGVCKRIHLPVTNIEYRFCRVAAFGPVLNSLQTHLGALHSPNLIQVQAIIDEIMHELKHIRQYNSHAQLYPEYTKHIAQVLKQIQKFRLHRYKNLTIVQYLAQMSRPNNRTELLTQLLTFDSPLLDLKMVHKIINGQDKKMFIAIAGGTHIKNMSNLLTKIGYQQVYASDITKTNEYNLQKCVGSHIINGAYCVKPKPIDLGVVQKFLRGR